MCRRRSKGSTAQSRPCIPKHRPHRNPPTSRRALMRQTVLLLLHLDPHVERVMPAGCSSGCVFLCLLLKPPRLRHVRKPMEDMLIAFLQGDIVLEQSFAVFGVCPADEISQRRPQLTHVGHRGGVRTQGPSVRHTPLEHLNRCGPKITRLFSFNVRQVWGVFDSRTIVHFLNCSRDWSSTRRACQIGPGVSKLLPTRRTDGMAARRKRRAIV